MSIRTLLVDDEPLARRELRLLLSAAPWIEIVGEASHVSEAVEQVDRLAPQLLFLDIQMPGGTGFDVLAQLDLAPLVIFTTAYDHQAVRAFEVNALDYLLKPIDPVRLDDALARVSARVGLPKPAREPSVAATTPLERLFVRDGPRCWFIPIPEVRLFRSEGNYTRIEWGDERPSVARSLANLESRLDPRRFFRANRTELVNVDFIEGVELGDGGKLHVQLRGGPEVELSRRQARLFRERMGT